MLSHVPVMLEEVVASIDARPGQVMVDGTLGLAGHALELGRHIAPGGLLVGLDWDDQMLVAARDRLAALEGVAIETFRADYRELPELLAQAANKHGRSPSADGVLLDLGVNNAHLEQPDRGLSFLREGPLDMRMDRRRSETAATYLNHASVGEISKALWEHGGENWAKRIAEVVVDRRRAHPLETTTDLVECVLAAVPAAKRDRRIHPATRTFQAVRIVVNEELEDLEESMSRVAEVLAPGGTMVVLSYHSGEDRAVKRAFRGLALGGTFTLPNRKPLQPTDEETMRNPKSRSAKMRTLRRVA